MDQTDGGGGGSLMGGDLHILVKWHHGADGSDSAFVQKQKPLKNNTEAKMPDLQFLLYGLGQNMVLVSVANFSFCSNNFYKTH